MAKEDWIKEAKEIMVNEHGFESKFAQETAEHNYEVNLEEGSLKDYTVRELIETELSYWGD